MKKVFPIITILITISLLAIIVIQYKWLRDMTPVQKEEVAQKIQSAEYNVVQILADAKSGSIDSLPQELLPKNAQEEVLSRLGEKTVAELFSVEDIKKLFNEAFAKQGLKGTQFEFAVMSASNNLEYEIVSPGFENYSQLVNEDTANYSMESWPLAAYGDVENNVLNASEQIIVITHDVQSFTNRYLGWMFAISLASIIILIAVYYFTVRAIFTLKKSGETQAASTTA